MTSEEIAIYVLTPLVLFFAVPTSVRFIRVVKILLHHGTARGTVVNTRFIRHNSFRKMVRPRSSDDGEEALVTIRFETDHNDTVEYEQHAPARWLILEHTAGSTAALQGRSFRVHYDKSNPERVTATLFSDVIMGLIFIALSAICLAALINLHGAEVWAFLENRVGGNRG